MASFFYEVRRCKLPGAISIEVAQVLSAVLQVGPVPESVCSSLNKVWRGTVMSNSCPGLRRVPWPPSLPFSVPWDA